MMVLWYGSVMNNDDGNLTVEPNGFMCVHAGLMTDKKRSPPFRFCECARHHHQQWIYEILLLCILLLLYVNNHTKRSFVGTSKGPQIQLSGQYMNSTVQWADAQIM